MDRRPGPRSPSSGTALRAKDTAGAEAGSMSRDGASTSPTSEYNTPLSSPTGQEFSGQAANVDQPLPSRPPPPPRPPRPHDSTPFQTTRPPQSPLPMRRTARSHEAITTHRLGETYAATPEDPRLHSLQPASSTSPNAAFFSATSRNAQFVAPPSPRRPGSSPYLSRTVISPILEESTEASVKARNSVASSRAVPSSWGSHPDDYNFDRVKEKFEEGQETHHSPVSPDSTASMHDDTTGLVRQASLGKRMKPSMTRIGSTGENRPARKHHSDQDARAKVSPIDTPGVPGASRSQHTQAIKHSPTFDASGNRTLSVDNSPLSSCTSSAGSEKRSLNTVEPISRSRSPLASTTDRSAQQPARPTGDMDRLGSDGVSASDKAASRRRPPRLDMEAVRDSDVRSSATSLPDLIRRATRLAANLDRGKTASRSGMLDFIEAEKKERRRSGSISDILASFPPPSRGTPDGMRLDSRWPMAHSTSKMNQRVSSTASHELDSSRTARKGRRCCGIPLYTFVILILLLLALIAAAIAVPIVLIVLPRQRQASASESLGPGLTDCSNSISCQNGGVGVSDGSACRCICVDGFTTDRCDQVPGPGCTTVDVNKSSDRLDRATVGSSVADLFSRATESYGVPLRTAMLLSLFSADNLSCTSENSLVMLKGQRIRRRRVGRDSGDEKPLFPSLAAVLSTPTSTIHPTSPSRIQPRQVVTSDGIVFDASSTSRSSPDPSANSMSQVPDSDPPPSNSSSSPDHEPTPETLDFARIAILYVFQWTGQLHTAVNAQDSIQDFVFGTPRETGLLSLGPAGVDLSIDFYSFTIVLANGTEVGGRGDGEGGIRDNKMRRSLESEPSSGVTMI